MTRAYFTGHVTRADASFGRRVLCTKCNMNDNAGIKEDDVDDAEEFVCSGCLKNIWLNAYKGQQQFQAPNLYLVVAPQEEADYQQERQAA